MNARDTERLLALLGRIADALEESNADHSGHEVNDRVIAVAERQADLAEEHVQWHRRQGMPSPEIRQ